MPRCFARPRTLLAARINRPGAAELVNVRPTDHIRCEVIRAVIHIAGADYLRG